MFFYLKEKFLVEVDGKVSDNNIMLNGVNFEVLKYSGQFKVSLFLLKVFFLDEEIFVYGF